MTKTEYFVGLFKITASIFLNILAGIQPEFKTHRDLCGNPACANQSLVCALYGLTRTPVY